MTCSWCGIGIGPGHEDEVPFPAPADYPGLIACGGCYRLFVRVGWRMPRLREDDGRYRGSEAQNNERQRRISRARALALAGKTRAQIAEEMGVSEDTARDYMRVVNAN